MTYQSWRIAGFLRSFRDDLRLGARSARQSEIAKNAASLYILQFANYILPLITVPYLVRVLGPKNFGLVAFGRSFIAYFAIFVDYGFVLSATRKISIQRKDIDAVSRTASSVWTAKSLICLAAFGILVFFIRTVPKIAQVWQLLLILYGIIIGNILFPVWLFLGMERMVLLAAINLAVRLLMVIGIFTLVRQREDYLLYAALISTAGIVAGLAGALIAFTKLKLRLHKPSVKDVWNLLVEGWILFLSTASVSLYTAGNAFILGIIANPTAVGYYSAAEKIVRAVVDVLRPIAQAAYPRFNMLASESKARALLWARRMIVVIGGFSALLSIMLFITAPLIVQLVLGSEFKLSIAVMRILALLPFLIAVSNILGVQLMFSFHYEKAVFVRVLIAGVINIGLAIVLANIWEANGMAFAVLTSETFVTASYFIYLWNKRENPLQRQLA